MKRMLRNINAATDNIPDWLEDLEAAAYDAGYILSWNNSKGITLEVRSGQDSELMPAIHVKTSTVDEGEYQFYAIVLFPDIDTRNYYDTIIREIVRKWRVVGDFVYTMMSQSWGPGIE